MKDKQMSRAEQIVEESGFVRLDLMAEQPQSKKLVKNVREKLIISLDEEFREDEEHLALQLRIAKTIPGHFICPKCASIVNQLALAPLGIFPNNSTPPNCLECGTEMWALTWKRALADSNNTTKTLATALVTANNEIVRLKKLAGEK